MLVVGGTQKFLPTYIFISSGKSVSYMLQSADPGGVARFDTVTPEPFWHLSLHMSVLIGSSTVPGHFEYEQGFKILMELLMLIKFSVIDNIGCLGKVFLCVCFTQSTNKQSCNK